MTRALFTTIFTSATAMFATACGDDTTTPDTSGDTIVDGSDAVDTGGDDATTTDTGATDATEADTDTVQPTLGVKLNEISATGSDPDWVELYNGGSTVVNIGGWRLRDNDELHSYIFPASATISAGAYYVVTGDPDGITGFDFGLGGGDGVYLYDAEDKPVDSTVWVDGEAPEGATYGRYPNGSGPFQTLYTPTNGTANVENPDHVCGNNTLEVSELCDGTAFADGVECSDWGFGGGTLGCADCELYTFGGCTPHAAALVINEVTSETDEIELFNGTGSVINLEGFQVKDSSPDNTYTFPAKNIAAGGYVVLKKDVDFAFGLGADDAVTLLDRNAQTVDTADWLEGEALVSYCRSPNGTGGFKGCATASIGSANP